MQTPPPLHRNPDFVRLWVGEAASTLGSQIAYIAYPLVVLAITGSPAKAGLVGFARLLPWFLAALPAGVLADRVDRRRLMIVSDVGAALAVASIPVAAWLDRLSIEHLLAVAFVEGTFSVLFAMAQTGALKQIAPAGQLSDAVARNEARDYAAYLAGPPIGGALFGINRVFPFAADALSYVVSLVMLLRIRRPLQQRRSRLPRRFHNEVGEGLAWLWREPFLRASEFLVAVSNFVNAGVNLALIVVAKEMGASASLIGGMLGLSGAGAFLGAVAAPQLSRRFSPRTIVVGFNWVGLLVVASLVTAPHPLVLGALFAVWLFFGPTWNATIIGYRIAIVPDELQGRVQSVASLIAFAGVPLGPLAAGYLLEGPGGDATLLAFAGVLFALALSGSLTPALRQFRGLSEAEEGAA